MNFLFEKKRLQHLSRGSNINQNEFKNSILTIYFGPATLNLIEASNLSENLNSQRNNLVRKHKILAMVYQMLSDTENCCTKILEREGKPQTKFFQYIWNKIVGRQLYAKLQTANAIRCEPLHTFVKKKKCSNFSKNASADNSSTKIRSNLEFATFSFGLVKISNFSFINGFCSHTEIDAIHNCRTCLINECSCKIQKKGFKMPCAICCLMVLLELMYPA